MKVQKIIKTKKIFLIFIVLVIPLFSSMILLQYAQNPLSEGKTEYTIDIPKGTSFSMIIDMLNDIGLIKHKVLFSLLALSQNAAGHIRAGEYEFTSFMSPLEVLRKLVKGEIKGYLITFPEDMTMKEVATRLASFKLVDEKIFMSLAYDRAFLASLGITGASLEGFLYPDTYLFDRSMKTSEIIKMMTNQFWKMVTPEMLDRVAALGFTVEKFVTMASIIGKESGNREEKALISAVFHNRLKKGMKLQSDPTAVYDLKDFKGIITRKDLLNDTPHNTYRIAGLPPGPIANPGIDSLKAALFPAEVDYLYFVSKNDGAHHFSSNFRGHIEAVSKYQINNNKE